jgi:hypothetical protein
MTPGYPPERPLPVVGTLAAPIHQDCGKQKPLSLSEWGYHAKSRQRQF